MADNPIKIDLRVDVSGTPGLDGDLSLAATAWLPAPHTLPAAPAVVFAVPGGGYARGYFDISAPGHSGYSQAEDHVARGLVVIALDHPGVGDSSTPDPAAYTWETWAAAYDRAVRALAADLRAGTLLPDFPPLPSFAKIGIGQSMGGHITIVTQGRHATFDAIAPLGYSAIHTVLPQPGSEVGVPTPVTDWVWPFHWEDVPADLLAADFSGGYPMRKTAPAWGSTTIPSCVGGMTAPGAVARDAAAVEVPVFVGVGERDVCPTPRLEPSAYASSNDITLRIVPRMAHMHNFASTRRLLWDDLAAWIERVARGAIDVKRARA